MKTRRINKRNNKTRKNIRSKKGGFWGLFNKNKQQNYGKVMPETNNDPSRCGDPNNITQLRTLQDLHAQYHKCCPKTWYGRKNSSPYCRQIDLNFQGLRTGLNNANEYHDFSPEEVYNMRNPKISGGKKRRTRSKK
jgi:hypothetical protein